MKISAFQIEVLQRMRRYTLRNTYTSPEVPYRPSNGMFSGSFETLDNRTVVPYRTINALMQSGLIEEKSRVESTGYFGATPFQSINIRYRLTDKGRNMAMEASNIQDRLARTGV